MKKNKNDYTPKSVYDDKIKEYEQKLDSYKNNYISKDEHDKHKGLRAIWKHDQRNFEQKSQR